MCCNARAEDQVGKALLPLPWFIVNAVIDAVDKAEQKLGTPPSSIEVFAETKVNHPFIPIRTIWETAGVLISIYREDRLYSNDILSHFSTQRREGYLTFSETFRKKFPGYKLDSRQRVTCDTKAPISFKKVMDMLKSTDPSLLAEF